MSGKALSASPSTVASGAASALASLLGTMTLTSGVAEVPSLD
ncbi:hypothetical protein AKJ09_06973 [Labilithrix luteola]|uniref:Uncharacterized protein n=1 Tax=Labilithrix luteola TaxID=1391654 RepID=A0A0K1Q4J5_9BACT|nr:hypothetical protein AKJ09_06973 [Labilithrix luteola]